MRKTLLLFAALALAPAASRAQSPPAPPAHPGPRLDRLVRLADFLESGRVDPDRFDMGVWGTREDPSDPEFAGCAVGWGTYLFAAEGLRLDSYAETDTSMRILPAYRGQVGLEATMAFFGVDNLEALDLFGPGVDVRVRRRTPRDVARSIRAFVARHRDSAPPRRPSMLGRDRVAARAAPRAADADELAWQTMGSMD